MLVFLIQSIIQLEGCWPEVHKTYPQKYKDKNSTIDAEVMLQSKKEDSLQVLKREIIIKVQI